MCFTAVWCRDAARSAFVFRLSRGDMCLSCALRISKRKIYKLGISKYL